MTDAISYEVREGPCLAGDAPLLCCPEGEARLEDDTRYWPMPGILRCVGGETYVEVYLPTLVPYATHDLRPRYRGDGTDYVSGGFEVRLPEGSRGKLERFPTTIRCVASPTAAAPCEGDPTYPSQGSREHESSREGARGHRWGQGYAGTVYCVRCRCSGALVPLTWIEPHPRVFGVELCRGVGGVTCVMGDDTTRRLLLESVLTTPPPSRDVVRIDVTPPSQRRAIRERALSPFDAGGRWLLPQDVTPETAPEDERPLWIDLGAVLVEEAVRLVNAEPDLWRAWLAGDEDEGPPHAVWGRVWWDGLLARMREHFAGDKPPIYIDARALVAALRRTGVDGWRMQEHPAAMLVSELRLAHDKHTRAGRPSVLLLLPDPDPKDREIRLESTRRVWASGR